MSLTDVIEEKLIARQGVLYLSFQLLTKLLALVYLVLISRSFAQQEIGTFYFCLALASSLAVLADFGFTKSLPSFIPSFLARKEGEKAQRVLFASIVFSATTGALVSGLLLSFSGEIAELVGNERAAGTLLILATYLFLFQLHSAFVQFLHAAKRPSLAAFLDAFQAASKITLTLLLLLLLPPASELLAFAFLAAFCLALLLASFLFAREFRRLFPGFYRPNLSDIKWGLRRISAFSLAVLLTTIFFLLAASIDKLMLQLMLPEGEVEVALYTMASSLAWALLMFPSAISSTLLPILSELVAKQQRRRCEEVCQTFLRWSTLATMPLLALFLAFPGELLTLAYTPTYAEAQLVLIFCSLTILPLSFGLPYRFLLVAEERTKLLAAAGLLFFSAAVLLNYLLIPQLKASGAALASLLAFGLLSAFLAIRIKELSWKRLLLGIVKPLSCGFPCFVLLLSSRSFLPAPDLSSMVLLFAVSLCVYLASIVAFKPLTKLDKELMILALRRFHIPEAVINLCRWIY